MKKLYLSFAAAIIVTLLPSSGAGQTDKFNVAPLTNKDILVLVDHKVESEEIIKIIKTSACTFDTFPPLLREMKGRGVPESVLETMLEAPYGTSVQSNRDDLDEAPIYHYTEQLKQLGYLAPLTVVARRYTPSRRSRAARSRIMR